MDHRLQLFALRVALVDVGEGMRVLNALPARVAYVVVGACFAVPPHTHDRMTAALIAPVARVHCYQFVQLADHFGPTLPTGAR